MIGVGKLVAMQCQTRKAGSRSVAVLFEDQEMIHLGCCSQERPSLHGDVQTGGLE